MKNLVDLQVMIVEDDPMIAESLRIVLQNAGAKIEAVVHNAQHAIWILGEKKIEFAILDVDLGAGPTGIDVARIIQNKYNIPFIFLTAFDDAKTLDAAEANNPYGYLVKPFQERSLITTIKIGLTNFNKIQNKNTLNKAHFDSFVVGYFTDREFDVIKGLVDGKSYNMIASDTFISLNTVKYHVKNIYTKLDVSGRAELVAKII